MKKEKQAGMKFGEAELKELVKAAAGSALSNVLHDGTLRSGPWSTTKLLDQHLGRMAKAITDVLNKSDVCKSPSQSLLQRVIREIIPNLPGTPDDIRDTLRAAIVQANDSAANLAVTLILLGAAQCRLGPGSPEVRANAADAVLILGSNIICEEFEKAAKSKP